MKVKDEYKGASIYVKALDRNIQVAEYNYDILVKHTPEIFECDIKLEKVTMPKHQKNDSDTKGTNQ